MTTSSLTISQALRKIKDLKGKIAKHVQNAQGSVTFKTKSPPAYSFSLEWEQATSKVEELLELQTRVAVANATTVVSYNGKARTLVWCTKKLAEFKGSIAVFEGLSVRSQEKTTDEEWSYDGGVGGRARIETEYTCNMPEAKRAECVASFQAAFAELNDLVESTNHRTTIS